MIHADRFDVVGYSFRDGGVEATVTTFLKFGDLPVPEVAKIIESVPAPQREKVWRDMAPSMPEADLLEGVAFGVVPIEVLSVALQMKLPVHVLYENGAKVSVEVLIGALKGVDKKRVMDLIKTLPSAKQKQVWDGYVATLSPEEISAGVRSGQIPKEYGPSGYTPNWLNFGDWKVHWKYREDDGREVAFYTNSDKWKVGCFVYPKPQDSYLIVMEDPKKKVLDAEDMEDSEVALTGLPKTWPADQREADQALKQALARVWPKIDGYIARYTAEHK